MAMLWPKSKTILLAVSLSSLLAPIFLLISRPDRLVSQPPPETFTPSQEQCVEAVQRLYRGGLSDAEVQRAIALLKQCQTRFWSVPDPSAPRPTFDQCVQFFNLAFLELSQNSSDQSPTISAEQQRSLTRCREVMETRYIPSVAMSPTLQTNDRVYVDKSIYRSELPKRGDIIIFQPTDALKKQNKEPFIKRIIGLPGERIEVRNRLVYINGKPLQENYIAEAPEYQYEPVIVPANQYFVLGDNRNNSYDSRFWGFVPRSLIIGQAIAIYCPSDRQRFLIESNRLGKERSANLSTFLKGMAPICKNLLPR